MIGPFTLTSGVVVRAWARVDAKGILQVVEASRDRLARWMPWVPFATTVQDFEDFIDRAGDQALQGTGINLGLFADETIVGAVGASIGSLNFDEADVGYWLAPSHEGAGVASEAVSQVLDWLFIERNMHRITIRAAIANQRSRAVAERLGFTYEGILRGSLLLEGEHVDAALYSLLAPEWRGSGG